MRAILFATTLLAVCLAFAFGGDVETFAQPRVAIIPLTNLPIFDSISRLTPSASIQACSLLLFVGILTWRKLRAPV